MKRNTIAALALSFTLCGGMIVLPENIAQPLAITASAESGDIAAPQNIKASSEDKKVNLNWDKVDGADAYAVYKYNNKTKKFEKYKTVSDTKITVSGLKNGTQYKFKITSLDKSGKTYISGKTSEVIKATPNKVIDNTINTWQYYDFLGGKKYTSGDKYDPSNLEFSDSGWLNQIQIIYDKTAVITYNDNGDKYSKICEYSNLKNTIDGASFKIYTIGEDKYLFYQFKNGDGENTYVFKNVKCEKKRITDTNKMSGRWTAIDFCQFELTDSINYNPAFPIFNEDLYITGATVKNGKITFSSSDGSGNEKILGKDRIENAKYFVYSIDDETYIYYQWINPDGDKMFYVLKKN